MGDNENDKYMVRKRRRGVGVESGGGVEHYTEKKI